MCVCTDKGKGTQAESRDRPMTLRASAVEFGGDGREGGGSGVESGGEGGGAGEGEACGSDLGLSEATPKRGTPKRGRSRKNEVIAAKNEGTAADGGAPGQARGAEDAGGEGAVEREGGKWPTDAEQAQKRNSQKSAP